MKKFFELKARDIENKYIRRTCITVSLVLLTLTCILILIPVDILITAYTDVLVPAYRKYMIVLCHIMKIW